jgi:hypothetical protein
LRKNKKKKKITEMERVNFQAIEKKWQEFFAKKKFYREERKKILLS